MTYNNNARKNTPKHNIEYVLMKNKRKTHFLSAIFPDIMMDETKI